MDFLWRIWDLVFNANFERRLFYACIDYENYEVVLVFPITFNFVNL